MSPLPSARVIDPRLATHYRPIAEGTHNAECRIEYGVTGGGWDPETGPTPGVPNVTYEGSCRVQYMDARERDAVAADQPTATRAVFVSLDATVSRQEIGARITITATTDLAVTALVGRVLTVESRNDSSIAFEHSYTCSDDQTNQPNE